MKISPARSAAFDILFRIATEKAFSSSLLPFYEEDLSPADRALCHELVLGTLRKQIYLDRVIDSLVGSKTLDTAVRIALRLGLYQLLFLDKVPSYSALNESVELVKRAKKKSAAGFVNAILRRATREKIDIKFADELDKLSVEASHPRWLIEKWQSEFGPDEARMIAAANNNLPGTSFRVLHPHVHVNESWVRSSFVGGAFGTDRIDQDLRALENEGAIYFQDEGSQLVAQATPLPPNGSFLDVCAAPGGKVAMIALRDVARRSVVVAGDLYHRRAEFLIENCRRQGAGSVNVLQYDAERALPFPDETFDTVLVDAPCSGTGTIRHNPEIRYFVEPGDFEDLADKQHNILKNASKTVKPGGSLIYSTCSLEKEENEAVARRFLQENANFTQVRPQVLEQLITTDGFARTWPHRDGMDGFFIAAFTKAGRVPSYG